mgnify:CR=1 FL=1
MKLIKDKILIRISSELRESIYSKEILDSKGNKVKLFKNVKEDDYLDERASFLNVQTGIVEEVSDSTCNAKKGDIALINYDICNSPQRFYKADGDDNIYFLEANTTYHETDNIAYRTQRSKRDEIVWSAGDIDELSGLLGVISENKLMANPPFVFLKHQSNIQTMISPSGMMYDESKKIIEREVLAISEESSLKYGIKVGDIVTIDDYDLFSVRLDDQTAIDCINDQDILCV